MVNKCCYLVMVFLFISMSFFSCNMESEDLDGLNISYSKKLIKRVDTKKNEKLLKDAASILDNYINLNLNWPAYKYKEKIDWNVNPYDNVSWLNYLYSLRMLAVLSEGYNLTSNKEYLTKGKEILNSWNNNYKNKELQKNKYYYIWNDHAVANRVINLIHFSNCLEMNGELDKSTKEIILEQLIESGNWLYDDRNYSGGNHAIMMDRALLYLGYSLPQYKSAFTWRNKAKIRFELIMESEVTNEGVSVENSPQYHSFIMDLLKDFIQLIKNFGDEPPKEYLDLFEKMKTYLVYVLQPNLIYPFQGDTYPISVPLNYSKKYADLRLDFVETKGATGNKPEKLDIVFPEAGYAILRERWGKTSDFENSTYINFIGGVPSRIHKHSDNLSLSLFSNKENILIDPGSWGYAKNDTVSYLSSTQAHNTFTINNKNILNFPVKSSKITKAVLKDSYSFIEAEFMPNPFEKYVRKLIFIKPNLIFLDDFVVSQIGISSVEQIFNLGRTVKKVNIKKNSFLANFKNSMVSIEQLNKNEYQILNYKGKKSTRGLYALRAEKSTNGNQMVFKVESDTLKSHFNNKTLIKVLSNKKSSINNIELKRGIENYTLEWKNLNGLNKTLTIDNPKYNNVFIDNLKRAKRYKLNASNINPDFGIDDFYILNLAENEFSLLFKLSENTTLKGLQKMTIGIKAHVKDDDKKLLSLYAKKTERDFDSWNIKEDEIIKTDQGNFIYLNITTKLKTAKKLKIFLFDRKKYVREIWSHTINDFYFDNNLFDKVTMESIDKGSDISEKIKLTNELSFEKIVIEKADNENLNIYFKLPKSVSNNGFLSKYKLGLHTYVKNKDLDKLTNYSKSKKRKYDAWDFIPEITEIEGDKYIIKRLNTPIREFSKIKLFLYDSKGYKGVIGNEVKLENITIE